VITAIVAIPWLEGLQCRAMGMVGILREFLESSTIHGVGYISTAKVKSQVAFFKLHY
jgi:hypothetical protein